VVRYIGMGRPRANHESNPHLQGLKFFAPLLKLLGDLRKHRPDPNRTLHYDDYLVYLLLVYFNPMFNSLRGIVKLSSAPRVQGNLGLSHTSLGSLSEASSTFDPELLRHLVQELAEKATAGDAPARPAGFPEHLKVLAADASLWRLLPRMARALYKGPLNRAPKGMRKGHFVFNVLRGTPEDAAFTDGVVDERHVLPMQLQPDALYLLDRGYCSWSLMTDILDAKSSFLARVRTDCTYAVNESRRVPDEATQAGVQSDEIVRINGIDRDLRILRVRRRSPPPRNLHAKKKSGKHASYEQGAPLEQEWILLTDRLDLDAEMLVEMYSYRWHIETFFRWLKVTLQCSHLLAESENGMDLQFYAALIASLLVVIHTGRKPTKGLLQELHLYLMGWSEWEQLEKEIARCKPASK
jgi:hypothetical protein